jgi:hypothetical protein
MDGREMRTLVDLEPLFSTIYASEIITRTDSACSFLQPLLTRLGHGPPDRWPISILEIAVATTKPAGAGSLFS